MHRFSVYPSSKHNAHEGLYNLVSHFIVLDLLFQNAANTHFILSFTYFYGVGNQSRALHMLNKDLMTEQHPPNLHLNTKFWS